MSVTTSGQAASWVASAASPAAAAGPTTAAATAFWPLAGTSAYERTDAAWRAALVLKFTHDLRRHAVDPWFPRSINRADGGFWPDFDRRWRRRGPGHWMLEFQARQTRTAARLGLAFPAERARWTETALHGFEFMRRAMADTEMGGWFWLLDRAGRPLHGATKHGHGAAYLVGAAVEISRLTGHADALATAQQVFEWLEAHLHDADHGGYYGWVTRAGEPILTAADVPAGVAASEPLGHGIGLKDANVNGDLLESLTLLAEVWPDRRVLERLAELFDIVSRRLVTADGAMHYMTYRDWSPVPTLERYGYLLQQPLRLLAAAALVGDTDRALDVSYRLVDHALGHGWDARRGLFIEAGPAAAPEWLGRQPLRSRQHDWWVQTEGVRSLVLLSLLEREPERYRAALDALLAGIDRELLDGRAGGWNAEPLRDVPLRLRLRGAPAKGDVWKDASHEVDMYLAALRMLRGLPAHAALE